MIFSLVSHPSLMTVMLESVAVLTMRSESSNSGVTLLSKPVRMIYQMLPLTMSLPTSRSLQEAEGGAILVSSVYNSTCFWRHGL